MGILPGAIRERPRNTGEAAPFLRDRTFLCYSSGAGPLYFLVSVKIWSVIFLPIF